MVEPNIFARTTDKMDDLTMQPRVTWFWIGALLHIPLVLAMISYSFFATLHAWAVLVIGIFLVLTQADPKKFVYLTGYIAGAELLWRMNSAGVFWEFGKYAIVLLLGMAWVRWRMRLKALPVAYIALLSISITLLFGSIIPGSYRDLVSFNLSGHLVIAAAMLVYSQIHINLKQAQYLLRFALMPIVGISFQVLYKTPEFGEIVFITESSFATSGYYGPNQISAVLGLGALLGLLLVLLAPSFNLERWMLLILSAGMFAQAMLTFSRGGVVNVLVAAPIAAFYLARRGGRSLRIFFVVLFLVTIFGTSVLPRLNSLTGGVLATRYQELDTTGRVGIIQEDLHIFLTNLPFGVGPGISPYVRAWNSGGMLVAPHTEYSRLLAEHGVIGIIIIMIFLFIPFRIFISRIPTEKKGIVLALMVWSLVEMSHAAMRIAFIPWTYTIGLTLIYNQHQERNDT